MNDKGIGDAFQAETKYIRGQLKGGPLFWAPRPKLYKTYPNSPTFNLPPAQKNDGLPLWETIQKRRSQRYFSSKPLTLNQLSQLLWACQGITYQENRFAFRAAPSAGALYPVETYLVINRVVSLEPGLYHYQILHHQLEQLKTGDFSQEITAAALNQDMAGEAAVVFIWTGIFARSKWKYGQRAYRYVYLDAGHIAQNLALAAVSLGLGSCPIAAFYDEEVNQLLNVDGQEESVLYLSVVGHSGIERS